MNKFGTFQSVADKARLDMINHSEIVRNSIHWGSSFSIMEILSVFFGNIFDKSKDSFILSKGHAAGGVYAVLHQLEELDDHLWENYGADGSPISELMEYHPELGFCCSGGSLGLGPSYGEGIALLKKKRKIDGRVYVIIGDGEADEGSVWEAFASISHYKLDNFTLIIDANKLQSDGDTDAVLKLPNLVQCLKEFGWCTYEVDGHDCDAILKVFKEPIIKGFPIAIVFNTIKGRGVSFMEGNPIWHDREMSKNEIDIARKEISERVTS